MSFHPYSDSEYGSDDENCHEAPYWKGTKNQRDNDEDSYAEYDEYGRLCDSRFKQDQNDENSDRYEYDDDDMYDDEWNYSHNRHYYHNQFNTNNAWEISDYTSTTPCVQVQEEKTCNKYKNPDLNQFFVDNEFSERVLYDLAYRY